MNVFSFLLYYLFLIPVSLLPFPVLRVLSSFMFFIIYHVAGYRKKVVMQNIRNSFPEKSAAEHSRICLAFYRHFADLILESFKAFTISKAALKKHLVCKNPELIDRYYAQNKSVIIAVGHYNSWEFFLTGLNLLIKHNAVVIYQPLTNRFFDRKINTTRSGMGTTMVSTKDIRSFFQQHLQHPAATVFAIDQSPPGPEKCYWMEFLNQETGVLFGAEKYSKEYDQPVLYARINKLRRSYYELEFFELCPQPAESAYGEITEKATRMLEKDIRTQPELWLWSHRRWKHKKPAQQKIHQSAPGIIFSKTTL
jgi:Kdo2-lipid IVA lauroyltransferase/acyltransferase